MWIRKPQKCKCARVTALLFFRYPRTFLFYPEGISVVVCVCPSIYSEKIYSELYLVLSWSLCFFGLFCFYIVASSFKFSSSPDSIFKIYTNFQSWRWQDGKWWREFPYTTTQKKFKATDTKRLFWAGQIQAHHKNKKKKMYADKVVTNVQTFNTPSL